jgi:UDP-MurNAc hydroxylase
MSTPTLRWQPFDDGSARARFEDATKQLDNVDYDKPTSVGLDEIEASFRSLCEGLHAKYPGWVLGLLGAVSARVPDLEVTVRFEFASRSFELVDEHEADLVVFGQPLLFTFRFPYGIQTLGVSARPVVHSGESNWARHRMLLSMYNAELYLKPRYLLSGTTLRFVWERRRGLIRQVLNRINHMKRGF